MHVLHLLGTVSLEGPAGTLSGHATQPRQLAILALLATAGHAGLSRDRLLALLWPDAAAGSARHALADATYRLRKDLGEDAIEGDSTTLRLNPERVRCDVVEFERAVEGGDPPTAARLYAGPFLDGFHLRDSVEFEHWKEAEARRIHRRAMATIETLAEQAEAAEDHRRAAEWLRQLLVLDPWNSRTVVRLMSVLAAQGDPANALRLADEHQAMLATELDIEPPAELREAVERLRRAAVQLPHDSRSPMPFDFDAVGPARPPAWPFVGRESQLGRLHGHLDRAFAGEGRVVFVTGETGTGKTALATAFCRRAMDSDPTLIAASGSCDALTGSGDPYRPFREILGQLTGDIEARWAAGSLTKDHATRLWNLVPAALSALAAHGPDLLGTLLGEEALFARASAHASMPVGWAPGFRAALQRPPNAPPRRQTDLFDQYARVLRALAKERPLLLVLDDLQWADAGSAALLFGLGRNLRGTRILVLGLYRGTEVALGRSAERHPLEPVVHEMAGLFGDVRIELDDAADRGFIDALVDTEPNRLGTGFRDALFGQTRGHALFTVELLRTLREEGFLVRNDDGVWVEAGAAVEWSRLPARVDAVIAERISRIPPEMRRVLSVASVEGERFTLEAIARVLGTEGRDLVTPLSAELAKKHRLIVAEGLERVGDGRLSRYRFRHILFQRFLYDRLDVVERAHLHERLGEALEALYGDCAEEIAAGLAHHFREAGLPEKATAYLVAAAEQAQRSIAPAEALAHYESALGALLSLPASEARDRRELAIQLAIAETRMGLIAPGCAEAFGRALELADSVGTPEQLFRASFGSFTVAYYGGDRNRARMSARTCVSAARSLGDPGTLQLTLGFAALEAKARGHRAEAEQYLEEAISLPDSRPCIPIWDVDAGAFARSVLGSTRWEWGFPEQAARLTGTAVGRVREAGNPTALQIMLFRDILIRVWGGDIAGAGPLCDEALESMKEVSLAGNGPPMMTCVGWCEVLSGRIEQGLAILEGALQQYETAGTRAFSGYMWALYARALGIAGRAEEGLRRIEWAIADRIKDEVGLAAEVHRHLGELCLALPAPDENAAEAAFRTAIDLARRQETPSWELLAATSLARLLGRQGRKDEARAMLAPVYGWFTEGFDWPYLVEAGNLLTELEAEAGTG